MEKESLGVRLYFLTYDEMHKQLIAKLLLDKVIRSNCFLIFLLVPTLVLAGC